MGANDGGSSAFKGTGLERAGQELKQRAQEIEGRIADASPLQSSSDPSGLVDITKPRFDLSTYAGRLSHFYSVTSPLTLLYSTDKLKEAQAFVSQIEARMPRDAGRPGYQGSGLRVSPSDAERYWKSKQLVQSSVHPETGEVIPLPFRLAAFMPTNLLIVVGMLNPANGLGATIFWQWVNQSLNVAVNYSNANKSVPMDMKEVGVAYAGATAAAVTLAVGLTRVVPKGSVLARLVPFASVASAGCVNVSLMRWKEIKNGVSVFRRDEEGERVKVGESASAGRRAVGMTAASRVMTNIPTMIFPPLLLAYLQKKRIVPQAGLAARVVDLTMIAGSMLVFLPPAIAYFPQTATVDATKLEPKFHDLRDDQGKPIRELEFNKGL